MLTVGQDFKDYKIVELLGQGGFGAVFKAHHRFIKVPGRHGDEPLVRAIKELSHTDKRIIDRFIAEAGVLIELGKVPGGNFTRVESLLEDHGRYYLVMEFVPGGTLDEAASRQQSEVTLLKIGIEVCKGLHIMHTNNPTVVHRDLKPANIKVVFTGATLIVKILDFGIAAVLRGGSTTHDSVGTFSFGSPAQLRGDSASPFMDQHSLGATLYYCMRDPLLPVDKRFLPFPYLQWGSTAERNKLLSKFHPNYQDMAPKVPKWDPVQEATALLQQSPYSHELQQAVLRMMSPNDGDKFPNIAAAQQYLESLLGGSKVAATVPSPPKPVKPAPPPPPPIPVADDTSGAWLPNRPKN